MELETVEGRRAWNRTQLGDPARVHLELAQLRESAQRSDRDRLTSARHAFERYQPRVLGKLTVGDRTRIDREVRDLLAQRGGPRAGRLGDQRQQRVREP